MIEKKEKKFAFDMYLMWPAAAIHKPTLQFIIQ